MLLRIYRGIGPGTILVIFLSLVLVWLQTLLNPVESSLYYNTNPAPLYSLLINLFQGKPLAGILFTMVLVAATGIYLVNFNTRLFFINERTFLPASLYVLLSGYISSNQVLNPVLPASILLLFSVDRLIVSYRKPGIAYNLFDASMIIGIAALIYTNIIWFYLLIIIGISLFRSLNFREILISFIGLLTPFIILYAFYYLTCRDIGWLNNFFIDSIMTQIPDFYWSPVFILISTINLIILVISLLYLWSIFNTKKVRSRKIFSLLTWMLVLAVVVYFVIPAASAGLMYVFLIPLVYILTHYLVMVRNKKIANYVFAIIFLSVLFLQLSRAVVI
ncbi:MAG TPA: hypothetical protein DEQ09_02090 [Bacteroidales bacterium]|nr:hypothetical protein [Bacteroidales bacterium]